MRTRLLLASVLVGLLALAALVRRGGNDRIFGEEPHSVQMHVHGSFSEGIGSIDSHTAEALRAGVDVLWWSDHDWRIEGYRHCARFSFDAFSEPMSRLEDWTPISRAEAQAQKGVRPSTRGLLSGALAEIDGSNRVEGTGSLRLEATADRPGFQELRYVLSTQRSRFLRPLACGVTLAIAVLPGELGPDAHAFVEVQLSLHPDPTVDPRTPFRMRYELTPEGGVRTREGELYRVPTAVVPGEWNRLELPLTLDVGQGFPGFDAGDNVLHDVYLGVAVRGGATARVNFDALELRELVPPEERLELERSMLLAKTVDVPRVGQILGTEISYVGEHLNEFGLFPQLSDYDALLRQNAVFDAQGHVTNWIQMAGRTSRRIVEDVHARGGLLSYNHAFGVETDRLPSTPAKEQVLAKLLANGLYGADILEVGYRQRGGSLAEHLWVWDRLGTAGRFVVGTGVSDSHIGYPGEYNGFRNTFVSWIWSRSKQAADLLAGLERGRVYFGDIARWEGRLDLRTPDGFRMGDVVVTGARQKEINAAVDRLAPGDVVTWVVSGEVDRTLAIPGTAYWEKRTVELHPVDPTVVRIEVRSARGAEKAFSNPITFVRAAPDHALARVVFD